MEHKIIKTDNGNVHYWISSNDSNKISILFCHGLTADHTMFEKQIQFFETDFNVITWDIPIHGLSKDYKNFSYKNTSEIIHEILVREKIEKVVLVGMSMGGYPCQHFAHRYPNFVQGFVALDTTPLGTKYYSKSDIWWLKRVKPLAQLFSVNTLRKSMAKSISVTDYSYNTMLSILKNSTKNDIVNQMDIAYNYLIKENIDTDFKFPILILLGDRDSTGKVKSYCKKWAKNINSPIHYIKNAAHFSNGDNPEQVNNEILMFINTLLNKTAE